MEGMPSMYVNSGQKDAQKILDQVLSLSVRRRAEMLLWVLVLSSPSKCFLRLDPCFCFLSATKNI